MSRLPATKSWSKSRIDKRFAFLLEQRDPSPISKVHALTQAAELALATDVLSPGVSYLRNAFSILVALPKSKLLPTPIALFGAVLQRAKVTLEDRNLIIECDFKDPSAGSFDWTAPTPLLLGYGRSPRCSCGQHLAHGSSTGLNNQAPLCRERPRQESQLGAQIRKGSEPRGQTVADPSRDAVGCQRARGGNASSLWARAP
jgi:hypothetical protein